MRIYSFLLPLFMLVISVGASAQVCGYTPTESEIARLLKNKEVFKKDGKTKSNVDIYIPITFHIVRKSDGTGGIDEDNIIAQMCALNAAYNPHDIYFYIKDKTYNYVNSTILYSTPTAQSGGTKMITEKVNNGKNAVNVFICENADTGGLGTTLGYYDPFRDVIVMRKSEINGFSGTLPHEMGHYFSLQHTFNGWDSETWDASMHGNPVNSMFSPGGVLNELANGSNCEDAGDFLCDTPADYNLGFGWTGCSNYTGGCKDFNGEELDPWEENFMGYFIGCDNYEFSDLQINMVITDYESSDRNFLNSVTYVPVNKGSIDNTTLLAPANEATVDSYNYVKLEWNEISGADGYIIEISKGINSNLYFSTNPYLHVTDLEADSKYRWKVLPYNEVGGCATFTQEREVNTGNIIASEDLTQIGITLAPTVLARGSELTINSASSTNAIVRIFDVQGQLLSSQDINLVVGSNTVSNTPVQAGLYFTSIEIQGKQQTYKVVVQ